jgi:3-oxoacyl-[acyl-carrier protein] reductase
MKNIVIIGAGKGIGLSIVERLKDDHSLFAITRTPSEDLELWGVRTTLFNAASDDWTQLDHFPEEIHGLVYCPGSINLKPFNRLGVEDFLTDFHQNVLGAVKAIQNLLPKLRRGKASVVLFSTVAAKLGMPYHASIASSKSAVEGLAKSLAAEFAAIPIRFNVVAPSLSDTALACGLLNSPEKREAAAKRHPLQRIGTVEDSATLVEFLLSDKSSWLTGQVIGVDGGLGSLKI